MTRRPKRDARARRQERRAAARTPRPDHDSSLVRVRCDACGVESGNYHASSVRDDLVAPCPRCGSQTGTYA